MVVAFHGLGDTGEHFVHTYAGSRFKPLPPPGGYPADSALDHGFLLVAPDCPTSSWGGQYFAHNALLVAEMVRQVESRYCVDTHRVYCLGFSNGAYFVGNLYLYSGFAGPGAVPGWVNPFAACIANSGGLSFPPRGDVSKSSPKPPIWVIWGSNDPANSGRPLADLLQSNGWPVKAEEVPGAGHYGLVSGDDLWAYFSPLRSP
jgi:predicted esterase